jgi:hypothetical protein
MQVLLAKAFELIGTAYSVTLGAGTRIFPGHRRPSSRTQLRRVIARVALLSLLSLLCDVRSRNKLIASTE